MAVFITFFFSWSCFVQFCTGVQGDIWTGLYVPYEVYCLPVPTHTLTKDIHALLFSNTSAWVRPTLNL